MNPTPLSRSLSLLSLGLLLFSSLPGQDSTSLVPLREKCEAIIKDFPGVVGVGVRDLNSGKWFVLNGDKRFPMQSVFKLPLAMAVLDKAYKKGLSLEEEIHIDKADLLPNTWSPLRDSFPLGNVDLTLDELLSYTVSQSDNNACDILFRWLGGPVKAQEYIRSLGIIDMTIATTEAEMHKDWMVQYTNWCTPDAMLELLVKLYDQKALSPEATDFLMRLMVETNTGPKRLKGLLPDEIMVAHKTGSSGYNDEGVSAATHDLGILILPDGVYYAVVVLITGTAAKVEACEQVIAQIAKAVVENGGR